ncbi:MAG TPA: hypothetical protein ENJ84_03090 [Gammaproteobacteria bacterium]|nr:hypothetical protein [Gammaproteobacteria bacterium]
MDLIGDLELASSLEEETFTEVISIYTNPENTSVDRAVKLNHLISKGGSDGVKAIARLLSFITDTVIEARDYGESIDELNTTVEKLSASTEQASNGWARISSHINELESYFVSKKIDSIKDRYSRVTTFQVTTDIRPVFDMKRENIESAIYPCILKIQTTDNDTFVCEFYEDSIDKLITELDNAKQKLHKLKSRYES